MEGGGIPQVENVLNRPGEIGLNNVPTFRFFCFLWNKILWIALTYPRLPT